MKYGIREICDVVLKAKTDGTKVGSKTFAAGQPVLYFDSLKTSTMEGAATTVYAQGGKGNARLVAWEGERTVTFTMEDALISEMGLAVLTGAGLYDGGSEKFVPVHVTERCEVKNNTASASGTLSVNTDAVAYAVELDKNDEIINSYSTETITNYPVVNSNAVVVMFDYYTDKTAGKQININASDFAGTYYLEASTLFRDADGTDHAAEFIIPKCKLQSNFTFTMASSGDPSTFTFTMDAFPDYTKFDREEKVFATIQVIDEVAEDLEAKKVTIYGADNTVIGQNVQLAAITEPANALVTWTINAGSTKATINPNGVIIVPKDATAGTVTVTATSGTATDTHEVTIVAAQD